MSNPLMYALPFVLYRDGSICSKVINCWKTCSCHAMGWNDFFRVVINMNVGSTIFFYLIYNLAIWYCSRFWVNAFWYPLIKRKHARTSIQSCYMACWCPGCIRSAQFRMALCYNREECLIIVVDEYTSIAYATGFFKFVDEIVRTW